MRWLSYYGVADVIRINSDDQTAIELNVELNTLSFKKDGQVIRLSDIEAVWYRKGRRWLCNQFLETDFIDHPEFSTYLKNKLAEEELRLSEYLHFLIHNQVHVLGSPSRSTLNKLVVLHLAKEIGLLVPEFKISNSRNSLISAAINGPIITKPIGDVLYLFETEQASAGYFSYTEMIDATKLAELPERLSPSFVQEQILKRFEVRVFFLEHRCYAMAIFSQSDEQTRVDFRRYNEARPNRTVPFKLPTDLEEKIRRLFQQLNLNTGSVDFIVDEVGRFFFLEINPVGQFSMISVPCNYYLERQVAATLREYGQRRNV